MGAVADAGNVLGHPLCITQNKNKPFFKRQHFLEFLEHVHVSKIGIEVQLVSYCSGFVH